MHQHFLITSVLNDCRNYWQLIFSILFGKGIALIWLDAVLGQRSSFPHRYQWRGKIWKGLLSLIQSRTLATTQYPLLSWLLQRCVGYSAVAGNLLHDGIKLKHKPVSILLEDVDLGLVFDQPEQVLWSMECQALKASPEFTEEKAGE